MKDTMELSINTIGQLNGGKAGLLIDSKLEQALMDCLDRPNLDKDRKVTIICRLRPISDGGMGIEGVKFDVTAKCDTPPQTTREEVLPVEVDSDDAGIHINAKLPMQYQTGLWEGKDD